MDSRAFSKENSLAAKGVAILMMMWHHCFLSGRFEDFSINFRPLTQSQVVNIADFCKICVSLFAFVSGYGLYLSYREAKAEGRRPTGWVLEKLIRTLSGYWFVLILAWIICTLLDGRPYQVYGFETSPFGGVWNMLVEFFGLTNLNGGALLNPDWWYISAAVTFIILLPLVCAGFEKAGCFCIIAAVLILTKSLVGYPGGTRLLSFLPIFCFGMAFSKYDLFGRWKQFWASRKAGPAIGIIKFIVMLLLLGLSYKLYYHLPTKVWWDVKWNIYPLFVILFLYDYIFTCPVLNEVLIIFGKHATNIWLVHTFIRLCYANEFTYGMGHFVLIILVLFTISLTCSAAIEALKKLVHYDAWINKLLHALQKSKLSV